MAYRLFAAEFDDAEFSYSESDEERAPNYVVTPTGARVNRLFAVGVLTEVEDVNPEMVRGRVVDPTGAFVTYAGQYQPESLAFLERAATPSFVALSGKARTFQPDDGDRIYTSVRPESISEVDAETRDRWVLAAAERTLERIGIVASALAADVRGDELRRALETADVDPRLADGVALALEYYGTTPGYLAALRETALGAVRVVAGELEEVPRLRVAPDETVDGADPSALATIDLADAATQAAPAPAEGTGADDSEPATVTADQAVTDTGDAQVESAEAEAESADDEAVSAEDEAVSAEDEAVSAEDEAVSAEDDASSSHAEAASEVDPGGERDTTAGTEPDAPDEEPAEGSVETSEAGEEAEESPASDELEDFEPGEFELDEEERREVEEEYGTEFSTADEVGPPGEASTEDEETETAPADGPDTDSQPEDETEALSEAEPASEAEPPAEAEPEPEPEVDADAEADSEIPDDAEDGAEGADEPEADPAEAPADDVDLVEAVLETMGDLDDGDGADREELVSRLVEAYGVSEAEVDDAIQDALMSGRCYEPGDGTLKPI